MFKDLSKAPLVYNTNNKYISKILNENIELTKNNKHKILLENYKNYIIKNKEHYFKNNILKYKYLNKI